jgi:hypothetical protein
MDKEDLCQKIKTIYPAIGRCGIDVDVGYDSSNDRWKIGLKRGNKFLPGESGVFPLTGKSPGETRHW